VGVKQVYALGGAQAVAAMAFGHLPFRRSTKSSVPEPLRSPWPNARSYGICGHRQSGWTPTETLVIADESARPDWIAADLLAQAEHDVLASAILTHPSPGLAEAVEVEIEEQLKRPQTGQR